MSDTLILPICGRSTRFPNMKPKWMLTHPKGNWMLIESIRGLPLDQFHKIIVVGLSEVLGKDDIVNGLISQFEQMQVADKVEILQLSSPTKNQAQTVYECIKNLQVVGSIFIKDCDNYFAVNNLPKNNYVCYIDLNKHDNIFAVSKSYIRLKNNVVTNIIEKQVISNTFCCGGYGFASADEYCKTYEEILDCKNIDENNLYISHIIDKLIFQVKTFFGFEATNYIDWGTLDAWNEYIKNYKTYFIDIDGVLIENTAQYNHPKWGTGNPLQPNIEVINRMYLENKTQIILTTARKDLDCLKSELAKHKINYHMVIYDLWHCQRIIINDFAKTNPYPSCVSISIPRNGELKDYL